MYYEAIDFSAVGMCCRSVCACSGKGFFIEKDDYAIAIRDDMEVVIENVAFKKHMKDVLEYRTMEYYRRRYAGEE